MWARLVDNLVSATIVVLNTLAPVEVHVNTNLAYAPGPGHVADVYRPSSTGPHPLIVFFYGGGWRNGSKEDVAFVGAALARRNFTVVIPEYRHFPAASLSDILDDNARAVAWSARHAAEFGGDPGRVVVMGHSSGAWAAAMLGLDPRWLEHAGAKPDLLSGVVGLAGPYSVSSLTNPEDREVFAGAAPEMQPIDLPVSKHPAMLLQTGAADVDVLPAGTETLADHLQPTQGVLKTRVYGELNHGQLVRAISLPFTWGAPVERDVERFVNGIR